MATKVLQEYESSLEDLSFNSKPIINMLTMEADKHTESAAQIVDLIETRFFKVRPEIKLPLLYLIDSIMKNLNGKYLQLFSRNIVRVFCHAFESLVDPKIRISLYKLRQTWSPYVAVKKLAAIDKHVHAIDPNWPITAHEDPNSPTIFLNPKFISSSADKSSEKKERSSNKDKISKTVNNTASTSPAPKVVNTSPSPPSSPSASNDNVAQKRMQLLKEQKQKKLDKQRAMGLAPPVSKLSPDQKHRSRSQSPGTSAASISKSSKPASAAKNKRRSASPSVRKNVNHVSNSDRETGSKSAGRKHHLESETQQSAEKKPRLQEIDEEKKEGRPRSPNVVKPIQLQQLSELPPELLSKHQEYIMKQAKKQLESGKLSRQQHEVLVQQVEELYSLHRQHKSPPPLSSEQTVEPYHSPPPPHRALPPEQPHYHDHHPPPHHPPSPPLSRHPPSPPPSHYHRPPSPPPHHHHRPPSPLPPDYLPPHHRPPSPLPPHHHHPPPPAHHPPPPPRVYHPEFDNEFPPLKRPLRPPPYNYPRRGHRGIQPPYWGGRGGFDRRPHPNDIRLSRRPPPHPVEQRPPPGREGAVPNMPVDVLLARLKNAGMLPPPSLTFKSDLKQHRQELIDFLLEGESCTSCGLRFSDHRSESYQQHLDWHFQQNRLEREGLLKTSRNWYLHPEDWLSFEELTNGIHNDPLPTLEQKKEEDLTNVEERRTSCRVLPDEGNEVCDLCQEQLEQFWEEDEDEWHFKDALRTEDNRLFHVYCYQDYKPTPMDASDTSLETAVSGHDNNSFVVL